MAVPKPAPDTARPVRMAGAADMRPCRRCGQTHPRRMIALMTLWFGPYAGLPIEGGYFYLCPACYQTCIAPVAEEILHRLTEHHPTGRRGTGGRPPDSTQDEDAPPP